MPTPSPAWRTLRAFAIACLSVYALALGFTYVFQDSRIYYPPGRATTPFDVTFQRQGLNLGGWVAPGPSQDALVVFGGNGQALEGWRPRKGLPGCTDRTLILVPYRSYEGNPGTPSEQVMVEDGRAVVDWARQHYAHVGVLGISLGSGVATAVAAEEGNGIDVLLLGTPYDRLDKVGQDLMPWLWPQLLMRDRFASVDRAARIQVPVRVLRAEDDQLVRAPRTAALMQAFGDRAQETVVRGDHQSGWQTPEACAWLRASSVPAASQETVAVNAADAPNAQYVLR